MNYDGKVIVENNYIHSNQMENIMEATQSSFQNHLEIIARQHKVKVQQLSNPAILINNRFGNFGSNDQDFVNFNVSSNRPGIHLFYEEQPFSMQLVIHMVLIY